MARICSLPEESKVKRGNTVCMTEGGAALNKTAWEGFAEVLPELRPQGARQRGHANRRGRILQEDGSEDAEVRSCEHAWGVFKKQEEASEVGQRGRGGGWVWKTGLGDEWMEKCTRWNAIQLSEKGILPYVMTGMNWESVMPSETSHSQKNMAWLHLYDVSE